jgi:hypothetical protein
MRRDREREIGASFPTDSIPMGGVGCDRVLSSSDALLVDLGQQRLALTSRSCGAAPCFTMRGHRGSTSCRREGRRSCTSPSRAGCRHTLPNCVAWTWVLVTQSGSLLKFRTLAAGGAVEGTRTSTGAGHCRSHPSPSARPASRGSIRRRAARFASVGQRG